MKYVHSFFLRLLGTTVFKRKFYKKKKKVMVSTRILTSTDKIKKKNQLEFISIFLSVLPRSVYDISAQHEKYT